VAGLRATLETIPRPSINNARRPSSIAGDRARDGGGEPTRWVVWRRRWDEVVPDVGVGSCRRSQMIFPVVSSARWRPGMEPSLNLLADRGGRC
jgi:hypothetical protein